MASQVSATGQRFGLDAFGDWFRRLRESAVRIARLADIGGPDRTDATHVLIRTLESEELLAVLGAPGAKVVEGWSGSRDAPYTQWLHAVWRRRCEVYFAALSRGLLASCDVNHDDEARTLGNRIGELASGFAEAIRQRRRPRGNLREALKSPHGITSFHVTYLDPTLYSCLILLRQVEDSEFPRKREFGIADNKEADDIRQELLDLIRLEVLRYTNFGTRKSEFLADDSTLWWAVAELVHQRVNNLAVGNYKGPRGPAEFCKKLVDWALHSPPEPDSGTALSEVTFEIHVPFRTRVLVLQNAVRILQAQWLPPDRQLLEPVMNTLVARTLEQVVSYPSYDIPGSDVPLEHAYFSGLGLEVVSKCLLHAKSLGSKIDRLVESPSRTEAKKWAIPAPKSSHYRALEWDWRTFRDRAEELGLKEVEGGWTFDLNKLPQRDRKRHEKNFELPRRPRNK